MHRMQFVMSTQTYGQWRNVIKLTVNRLSADAVSGLQPLRSLPNAATVTSAVLSIPLATFSVCSVFPSTLRCLCNRQRASSAVKLYSVEATVPLTTERWGLRKWFRSHLWLKNASDLCLVGTRLATDKNVNMLQKHWHLSTLNTVKISFSKVSCSLTSWKCTRETKKCVPSLVNLQTSLPAKHHHILQHQKNSLR